MHSFSIRLTSRVRLFLAAAVVLGVASLFAQPQVERSPEAEKLFNEALVLYKKGEYSRSVGAFDRVLQYAPASHRASAAFVMKGKAQLYAGDYVESEKTLKAFLHEWPLSDYRADAEYTLGLVFLKGQLPAQALDAFVNAWQQVEVRPKAVVLREQALTALDSTIDNAITLTELQEAVSRRPAGSIKELLMLKLGQKQAKAGDYPAASATLNAVLRDFILPSWPERREALKRRLASPADLKLGLLLPFMKRNEAGAREREIATGLQEGITLALDEYMKEKPQVKVTIEARDSERDPAAATSAMNDLSADLSVVAVIGPVFSSQAQTVSSVAMEKGVSLITPTANANGIAAIGGYVFQANPDLETRARAMASYAVNTLQMKRLAVLASTEPTSKILAEEFSNEVNRLGASIVATEWYAKGTTNLQQQLTSLRRKANSTAQEPYLSFNERMSARDFLRLNRLGISTKVLDTLRLMRSVVNATDFLGAGAKELLDANAITYHNGDPRIDSLTRIVKSVQGLYCAIGSSAEIGVVSSQIAFFGIETRLLGSGEWESLSELNASKRYTKGVVFETDMYIDPKDAEYSIFVSRFAQRYNRIPNKNNLYGYDVAKLVLSLIKSGATTREQLMRALNSVQRHQSLHGKITFVPRRVNTWLHIMQYKDEAIHRIGEVSVE